MTDDCLHCAIHELIDEHNERLHLETGEPVDVYDIIDDLVAVTAELIAYIEDPKDRKHVAKRTAKFLQDRLTVFRATGRFPRGPGQPGGELLH